MGLLLGSTEIVYEVEAQPFPRRCLFYMIFCFDDTNKKTDCWVRLFHPCCTKPSTTTVGAFWSLSDPNNLGHFGFNSCYLSCTTESRLAELNAMSLKP